MHAIHQATINHVGTARSSPSEDARATRATETTGMNRFAIGTNHQPTAHPGVVRIRRPRAHTFAVTRHCHTSHTTSAAIATAPASVKNGLWSGGTFGGAAGPTRMTNDCVRKRSYETTALIAFSVTAATRRPRSQTPSRSAGSNT